MGSPASLLIMTMLLKIVVCGRVVAVILSLNQPAVELRVEGTSINKTPSWFLIVRLKTARALRWIQESLSSGTADDAVVVVVPAQQPEGFAVPSPRARGTEVQSSMPRHPSRSRCAC